MDKKKKIKGMQLLCIILFWAWAIAGSAQHNVKKIDFCNMKYEYGVGKDSITLYLKVFDGKDEPIKDITAEELENFIYVFENGKEIPKKEISIVPSKNKRQIPGDHTFSLLIDLSIPEDGKKQIYNAVSELVNCAQDSSVYISFFGDKITSSKLITKSNYTDFEKEFLNTSSNKYFYGALFSKIVEFSQTDNENEELVSALEPGYKKNVIIRERGGRNPDKNIMFLFTESTKLPDEENMDYLTVTEYQSDKSQVRPKVYAFYFDAGNGIAEDVELTLDALTGGSFTSTNDLNSILNKFKDVVQDQMPDFELVYKVSETDLYHGEVIYKAKWGYNTEVGEAIFTVGTEENPWPIREESTTDWLLKLIVALIITALCIAFFFVVMKVFVPYMKSRAFAMKYYKKYVPEANVQRRICHYCKQEILPGQDIVTKCKHVMHLHCWKQNGYKCAEFGQNCKTGIQEHIEWSSLFTASSLRDCYQTITGILAGLVSWIFFELTGRGGFGSLAKAIVGWSFPEDHQLFDTCVTKVSAFLTIGLLLGFFLSLVFRYNDEYRKKDGKVYLKIIGLSLLTSVIGLAAFVIGAVLFCTLLSVINTTYIPWYCSLPAYLLFSVCITLSLTIKSTIPVKSALIGGLCSAVIGFFVLYFSGFAHSSWVNMLLNFVIYGGGVGASLITVRMLAEKYFLVIQNGIKAGQKIPIHKWMNATGGGNKVSIGMTGECEIQMNWEKSNKVAKEHAKLYIDPVKSLPMINPLATGVLYNNRVELPVGRPSVLSNGDTFKIGDTIFQYTETE